MKYLYLVTAHLWSLPSRPAGGSVTDEVEAVSVSQFRLCRRFEETCVGSALFQFRPPFMNTPAVTASTQVFGEQVASRSTSQTT